MQKKALITGITGQDGSYLAEYLLDLGYIVIGVRRRGSTVNTERIDHLYKDPQVESNFLLEYGDMTDMTSLIRIIAKHNPDEIYNLAAQSHVKISFENPNYTLDSIGNGILYLIEAAKSIGRKDLRIYQASTSELFGGINMPEEGYNESSQMIPMSPYAAAKLYAFTISRIYREAYGMFISNGILFNHESPRRGKNFVTRKAAIGVAKCINNKEHCIYMGNLDSLRDWGHAKDYVKGMHKILQHKEPEDYILATGKTYSVRYMLELAFKQAGKELKWSGKAQNECGYIDGDRCVVRIDERYFRPLEVNVLKGNPQKAFDELQWKTTTGFSELIGEIVEHELMNFKHGT